MKTGEVLHKKGTNMFILIYGSSLPSPRKLCHFKITRCCLLRMSMPTISSSAGAPKFSWSITERHADNSLLRQYFIHLWTHIGVEFTQYVHLTHSTPGEDIIAILVYNLFYPSTHMYVFFFISPFLYETSHLGFSYLLFLCLILPPSIQF